MFNTKETSLKVAEFLLQIKAIKLQPQKPFTWASGWNSPIYCDNRITLSYPTVRTYIRQRLAEVIHEEFSSANLIAGVATAGIPQGVLVAQELGLPFAYVRSAPKDHGMNNMIEGEVKEGQKVVVVEDIKLSTPKTKEFASILNKLQGANRKSLLVLPEYDTNIYLSARNLAFNKTVILSDINTYDVTNSNVLIFTESAAKFFTEELETA